MLNDSASHAIAGSINVGLLSPDSDSRLMITNIQDVATKNLAAKSGIKSVFNQKIMRGLQNSKYATVHDELNSSPLRYCWVSNRATMIISDNNIEFITHLTLELS